MSPGIGIILGWVIGLAIGVFIRRTISKAEEVHLLVKIDEGLDEIEQVLVTQSNSSKSYFGKGDVNQSNGRQGEV